MISLDDFEQNHELIERGKKLAKELSELVKGTYPNKCIQFIAILRGSNGAWCQQRISEVLMFKINELLQEGNSGKKIFIPDECRVMIEDLYTLIKENYNDKPETLHEYVTVLSDSDGRDEFFFALCN